MPKLIAVTLIILAILAGILFTLKYQDHDRVSLPGAETGKVKAADETSLEAESKTADKKLYELKNSIKDVIGDSIQDDIQQAVQSELNKSETSTE